MHRGYETCDLGSTHSRKVLHDKTCTNCSFRRWSTFGTEYHNARTSCFWCCQIYPVDILERNLQTPGSMADCSLRTDLASQGKSCKCHDNACTCPCRHRNRLHNQRRTSWKDRDPSTWRRHLRCDHSWFSRNPLKAVSNIEVGYYSTETARNHKVSVVSGAWLSNGAISLRDIYSGGHFFTLWACVTIIVNRDAMHFYFESRA